MTCEHVRVGDCGQRFEIRGSLHGSTVRGLAWCDTAERVIEILDAFRKWPAVEATSLSYVDRGPAPANDTGGGSVAIVCSHGRTKRCACGRQPVALCDWKTEATTRGRRKDCDAPLCKACTTRVGPEKDLCRAHAEEWGQRLADALYGGSKAATDIP